MNRSRENALHTGFRLKHAILAVSFALTVGAAPPVVHAATTPDDLAKAIESAKILPASDKVKVDLTDNEMHITVLLNRDTEEMDKDCKIDAVLIAKAVMDAESSINRVKVRLADFRRRTCRQVTVKSGDVAAFGTGGIGKETLLKSLEVQPVDLKIAWSEVASDAINKSKIFGPDFKVTVAQQGDSAVVSTYASKEGSDKDFDCKATAIVLAEKLLIVDPTLAAVNACFYDSSGKSFREVDVTSSDIRSFQSGTLPNESFLAKLVIVEHQAATAGSTAAATTKTAVNAAVSKEDENYPAYSAAGLMFRYPKQNWIARGKQANEEMVKLVSTRLSKDDYITLDVYQLPTSVAGLLHEQEKDWISMNDSQLLFNKPRRLGAGNAIGGLDWLFNYYSAGPDYPEYHYYKRFVYFGQPGRIYRFGFHSIYKNYQAVNTDFERILATLVAPSLRTQAPTSKPASAASKHHK